MKTKTIILLLSAFYFPAFHSAFAQTDGGSYLGVSFGGSDFHIRDIHASELIFRGVGIAPALQYINKGKMSAQYAEASFYSDNLSTTNANFNTDNWRARARYSYLHTIAGLSGDNVRIFLGGSLSSLFCASDYYFSLAGNFTGRAISSWYWSHSLDLSLMADYSPAYRESFSLFLFFPVVSNVSRPQYSSSGDYSYTENNWKIKAFGRTESFIKNFSVNSILLYQRPVLGDFNLQLSYGFFYSFYGTPQDINMYMNDFRAGFFYCF
jgi:hypothetical protein